jgi:hypothetical protein
MLGPASSYEVRTTITLTTSGGYFLTMLRASPGSLVYIGKRNLVGDRAKQPDFFGQLLIERRPLKARCKTHVVKFLHPHKK